jgi:prophage regulatory protein
MSDRFLNYDQLRAKGIPWSKVHLWRLEKVGRFPKRVKLGPGTMMWVEGEIDTYKAQLLAEREKTAA